MCRGPFVILALVFATNYMHSSLFSLAVLFPRLFLLPAPSLPSLSPSPCQICFRSLLVLHLYPCRMPPWPQCRARSSSTRASWSKFTLGSSRKAGSPHCNWSRWCMRLSSMGQKRETQPRSILLLLLCLGLLWLSLTFCAPF